MNRCVSRTQSHLEDVDSSWLEIWRIKSYLVLNLTSWITIICISWVVSHFFVSLAWIEVNQEHSHTWRTLVVAGWSFRGFGPIWYQKWSKPLKLQSGTTNVLQVWLCSWWTFNNARGLKLNNDIWWLFMM